MNEIFYFQNLAIQIIRSSRRKTITIQIKAGQVALRVPNFVSHTEIQRLLLKKNRWINEKLQTQYPVPAKRFVSGEVFSYLTQEYPLVIAQGNSARLGLYQQQLVAIVRDQHTDNSALIKRLLVQWYQQQATLYLHEKTQHYAQQMGVTVRKIVVKTFKARWGSCSSHGEIQYNWKIIMATPAVVDYVVIHELCHLVHHNHSVQFWQTVEFYLPNYREAHAWLKQHGRQLEI